jgi:hypothetical protein
MFPPKILNPRKRKTPSAVAFRGSGEGDLFYRVASFVAYDVRQPATAWSWRSSSLRYAANSSSNRLFFKPA